MSDSIFSSDITFICRNCDRVIRQYVTVHEGQTVHYGCKDCGAILITISLTPDAMSVQHHK